VEATLCADQHRSGEFGPPLEVLSKRAGESERRLREVFQRAARLAPAVVLMDELDAVAGSRDAAEAHHQRQLVSQLLVLVDGPQDGGRVLVLATTTQGGPARREGLVEAGLSPAAPVPRCDVDVEARREGRVRVALEFDDSTLFRAIMAGVGRTVADAVLDMHGGCVNDAMRDLGVSRWLGHRPLRGRL
jgi:hypothetical protein